MSQAKSRLVLGGACLLALIATSCSSDGPYGGANSTLASGAASSDAGVVAPAATDTGGAAAPAATDAGGTVEAPPVAALTIENSTFSAASAVAGTAFTIANNDGVTHTVTEDNDAFDVEVAGGGTASLTIIAAGTYQIHCKIHGSMQGTITVG
jgi:plastocyanin